MLNRSEILRAAWARYRSDAKWLGYTMFCRLRFAAALRSAWADAKLDAFYAQLEAEEAAEAAADPVKAEARAELMDLQFKDHWTSADVARVSVLNHALAA